MELGSYEEGVISGQAELIGRRVAGKEGVRRLEMWTSNRGRGGGARGGGAMTAMTHIDRPTQLRLW